MRQIPTITKNLLIINVICFLAYYVLGARNIDLNSVFGLHYIQATDFHLYQLITYMFMHGGFSHLFFNMFALWMFGGVIERTFGPKRYLIYYIVCGLGAAFCQEVEQFLFVYNDIVSQGAPFGMFNMPETYRTSLNVMTTVGASGSIYGILLAFGMCYPEERMFIFPLPVPIKAKWFVLGYAAIELYCAFGSSGDGVAHIAHLGGMLFGFVMIKMWRKHSSSFNGWDGYEVKDSSKTILGRIRKWLHLDRADNKNEHYRPNNNQYSDRNADWEYNAKKKANEEEIDKILDKIRRSGYESLTEEEKKKLFENRK